MIRIEAGRRLPVSVRDGFDYITDPRNWLAYWPRVITVDPDTRWQRPGDRARIVVRLAGRRAALDMHVEYDPRTGWRGLVDRSIVRRATERAVRETLANLDEQLRRGDAHRGTGADREVHGKQGRSARRAPCQRGSQ